MRISDSLFLEIEEERALGAAQVVCKTLGLRTADSLDAIIADAEIERDWRQTKVREVTMAIRAFKALRPAMPRTELVRAKAEQAYDDMVSIMDVLTESGIPMTTPALVEFCPSMGIPEGRVRYALEMLALGGKIDAGPDGWVIQGEHALSGTVS
ncbi:hypothetical protein [Acidocella sp. KAb 2-4]|uniref:hypothetical protein n=1 Tax=Acidocella sp. KAb 2-4 TaxID=2885158 RepID=UPI001D08377F|nr:hypothetical protein [Acidocella sp. KAb 2-4]MCB5943946.1 hypothetical protein [Acidocella sp. KAb 2-4]